jgi:hypothetical protein
MVYDQYIRDILHELLDKAREAKADYASKRTQSTEDDALFEAGRALGYYEAASLLVNQLEAFGIPRSEVGLPESLNLDAELL